MTGSLSSRQCRLVRGKRYYAAKGGCWYLVQLFGSKRKVQRQELSEQRPFLWRVHFSRFQWRFHKLEEVGVEVRFHIFSFCKSLVDH